MTQTQLAADRTEIREWSAGDGPPSAPEVPEHPAFAANVELVGELQGAGFQTRQWLIQQNGQYLQVTELLYRIAEQVNGKRSLEEIAAGVTESTDWMVNAEHVHQILRTKFIPLGLIARADGTVVSPRENQTRSPLQIHFRKNLLGPGVIEPIARVLQVLYVPPLLIPLLFIVAVAHGWLYWVHGVADSVRAALYTPGGLLVVLALMIVSGIFHEFGHAAALRYGGGKVRGMGSGLYLVYPTFYTDTTDAYRLGRWARLRTDLGGIYFHLIFAVGLIALYFVTGQEILLAVALLVNGDILYQLIPIVRLDGYWALTDLTGVPDFFSQTEAFVRGRLPHLKPWVKVAFTVYILLTFPLLALLSLLMVANFPRWMAFAADALLIQIQIFSTAYSLGDVLTMGAAASQFLLLTLSMFAGVYLLYSIGRKLATTLWAWSKPTPTRRLTGVLAAAGVLGLVALLWIPSSSLSWSVPAGPAGTENFEITERAHVQPPVSYSQIPPVGGNHAGIWQNCGFYDTPIASEYAVHSLEHGAVWITYQPDLAQEQIDALYELAQRHSYVLVSPFPDLPTAVVASAWSRQLHLESTADPRLEEFIRTFELGRQAPERGGGCTGGIGKPR